MNSHDEPVFQSLRNLAPPAPTARDARIRQRCHARLLRRQRIGNLSRIAALAALFLYLSAALTESLRLGLLR
ncbi:MAG: hypothetical protein JNK87_36565 [Bryobacterales bacterium]|nr:hypothetical protein [Bryobacterales bacterium]